MQSTEILDQRPLALSIGWGKRIPFFVIALLLLVLASTSGVFRNPAGYLNASFALMVAASAAVAGIGLAIGTRWLRSVSWLILALLGQAAALQWIDAGPWIHYQHYRPPVYLLQQSYLGILLAVQTILVAGGLIRHRNTLRAWVREHLPGWRLFALAAVIFLPAAPVSREIPFYFLEILMAAFVQAIHLGNLFLILSALPEDATPRWRALCQAWLGPDTRQTPRLDRFAYAAAIWVTAVSVIFVLFVYENHPHIPDEVAYLYHARYFADGKLAMPVPPAPAAFNTDLLELDRGMWYSPVPVGWPALLSLGMRLGVPWLVNPLLGGLGILLVYLLVQHFETLRTARWSVLLLAISPWHLFLDMSFMTHAFTMVCALAACEAIARMKREGSLGWAIVAGAAIGTGSLIRPLDGLIAGTVAGLWAVSGKRLRLPALALIVLSAAAAAALTLPYNRYLTGDPMKAPIMAYTDHHYGPKSNALGFGPERGLGWALDPYPGHTPLESLINDNLNAFSVNVELFGWATGSFFLLAAAFFVKDRRRGLDWVLLGAVAVVLFAYTFYWYSGGPDFGARYWYLVLVPLTILSARGIRVMEEHASVLASLGVLSLCLLTVINYLPWRAVDKYHDYLHMHPDVRVLAEQQHFGRSLVLIRGDRHPDFASAVIYNPLDLQADAPIYAWDANPEARAELLRAYPDRPVWILDGPTRTGAGFRVAAGPLPAATALAGAARP